MKEEIFSKTAKIISIGDELLIGQVVNTNASWLGEQLTFQGFHVVEVLTCGDGEKDIIEALTHCNDADLVIMTGGLGPTADDITKPTLCKFFNTTLILNEDALHNVERIFALKGFPMTERNRQQAMIPRDCTYIPNRFGTAPCTWLEKGETVYISMPGVPFEMRHVFTTEVIPMLQNRFDLTAYGRRTVKIKGIGESFLADKIADWETNLPSYLSLAYLPQHGVVRLRLDGRLKDQETLEKSLTKAIDELKIILGDMIFAFEDEEISSIVVKKLRSEHKTLCSAESCTGGTIARMITGNAGCSDVFRGGVVAYQEDIKSSILDVNADDIKHHGVVSKEVARQMAEGARKVFSADYAIATTGVAGPSGGTEATPVGTVWIAIASEKETKEYLFNFGNDRENVIQSASITALDLLRKFNE